MTVSDPTTHGLVPRGSVTFSSNGGASGHFNHRSCTLRVEHGKVSAARCAVTFTASSPLAYTITARYGGDVHHSPGTDQAVVRTARATSATTVSCTPSSVKVGVMSSCTATATGVGSPPVTITFKVSGGTVSGERCSAGPNRGGLHRRLQRRVRRAAIRSLPRTQAMPGTVRQADTRP